MANDEIVEGLQSLLQTMEALPLSKQTNLVVRSLRKAAEPIIERFKELAPDDPETPGSRIADSAGVTVRDQTATGAIAEIGSTRAGFPIIFLEVGTAHQVAQPSLQPAFDQKMDEAYALLAEILGDGIEREFGKLPT